MTDQPRPDPEERDTRPNGEKTAQPDDGGLVPKDSRNVTGTTKVEDGRWTGAAVHPEEGPKVPDTKD
ncbi:hypothetical protein [Blastomonas sp. AAP53]|uniref:hypothetical protein n=1 Tax=Blastomonas sp. AAP53 TaxID=1248760 RepID=UPI0012678106|nr:hypothetical protein [Blastomonas sp. AAP53]